MLIFQTVAVLATSNWCHKLYVKNEAFPIILSKAQNLMKDLTHSEKMEEETNRMDNKVAGVEKRMRKCPSWMKDYMVTYGPS